MGRAPIPGGPQRVSAHVVSKAKPYPDRGDADEQEPTNLGSQWEDEASTTVEQGDVADKVRTLGFPKHNGNTNHTHTGTGVDEPTVDDQHAPVLSAITPIRQDNTARLLISQGNDAGQEIEISPGKSYTIGRGLDNDVVLTDIAVSRKHFDLKFEDGAWIIVDRGSGNGTVVNGNVEDNPFMLAHGDMIEIGNTVFRYDQPNGAPRASKGAFDEDEEMSTVAGKPLLRQDPVDDPPPPPQRLQRPKTLPPPVPLRSAHVSTPPPNAFQATNPFQPPPPLQPASTLPMPQMANRPPLPMPLGGPMGPMGPMVGSGSPTMLGDAMGMPMAPAPMHLQNMQLNGMQQTIPGQGLQHPSYPYPQAAEIPPHSVHAQMLMIQTQGRRGDNSTAHVAPAHYDPLIGMPPPRYDNAPQVTKRTKLAIAGVALALLTGIVTAAVVKSGSSKSRPAATAKKETGKKDPKKDAPKIETAKPTAEPIVVPAKDTPKPPEPKGEIAKTADAPKIEPKVEAKAPEPKVAPKVEAKAPEPPKVEKKVIVKAEPPPKKKRTEARREPTTVAPAPKRVAVAVDSSGAIDRANGMYKNKKFNDAANVLATAAKTASEDEASDLRDKSKKYGLLGKAYAQGMAPAQKATIAFEALQQASNLDANVGGEHQTEINDKRAAIAPKAAVAFSASKEWGKARTAYQVAQRAGSSDPNLAIVKQKLEAAANELYVAANAEASSNPGPAKEKLKQIRTIVDPKSPIAIKAQALLNRL